MKAFILTAGLGERLKPVTEAWPKPSVPLLNIPILYYSLTPLLKLAPKELVFNLHHLPDGIRKTVKTFEELTQVSFSDETDKLLGSGGGIGKAKKFFESEDYFVVVNGDTVFLPEDQRFLKDAIDKHKKSKALATLLVMSHDGAGTKYGGVWCNREGVVKSFGKDAPEKNTEAKHFIGFQILSKKIFDYIPEGESNIFYDVMTEALKKGEKILSVDVKGEWFETGNERDYLRATHALIKRTLAQSNKFLNELGGLYWPNNPESQKLHPTSKFSQKVLAGPFIEVEENVAIEGYCVLGAGVTVGKNSKLENCVVLPGASIPEGFVAKDTLLFSAMP